MITDASAEVISSYADGVMDKVGDMGAYMHKTFDAIGRSLVKSFAVMGVRALTEFIIKAIAAKFITSKLGDEEKSETKIIGLNTGARAANSAAAGAQAIASGITAGVLAVEGAAVKLLTKHYIALAAAKAAASLGMTSAASITAAAATKAALEATLKLEGFDDPRNDAVAFRHGKDYAQHFMEGIHSIWRAPNFGRAIRDNIPVSRIQSGAFETAPTSTTGNINIYVAGSVVREEELVNSILPLAERMIDEGNSAIEMEEMNMTGGRV